MRLPIIERRQLHWSATQPGMTSPFSPLQRATCDCGLTVAEQQSNSTRSSRSDSRHLVQPLPISSCCVARPDAWSGNTRCAAAVRRIVSDVIISCQALCLIVMLDAPSSKLHDMHPLQVAQDSSQATEARRLSKTATHV